MEERFKKSLRELLKYYQAKWVELGTITDAARNPIDGIGAAVSYRQVEYIPLVVLWASKSFRAQEFFSCLQSASFDREIADIIQKAKLTALSLPDYNKQEIYPYELLLTKHIISNSYHRFKPSISNYDIFKKQLYYLLYNTIMPFNELLNKNNFYRPSDSERPNWIAFLAIGSNSQTHDLIFAMSLTKRTFFDPRLGEFRFKSLKLLTDFIVDFLFDTYGNYCSCCFCYVMDFPTPIDFLNKTLYSKYQDSIRVKSQDLVRLQSVKCY